MGLHELFEALLERLDSVRGHVGCTLVTHEGLIVASHIDRAYPHDKIAALGSLMVSMCKRVTNECGFGRPLVMVVEGEEGKMAVVNAHHQLGYIFLLGNKDMNMAMARLVLQETLDSQQHNLRP